jgi:CRP/FNR family transcriptional regulator, cyclic AMP receptor protein
MEDAQPSNEATRPLDEYVPEQSAEPATALPPIGILAGLSDPSLEKLAPYGRCHRFPAGTEVMREGEMQDRFYVVVSGELAVSCRAGSREVPLSVAKAGECLGELNLLEPGPAAASVRVVKDATMWSMDIGELRNYLFEHTDGAGVLLTGMASCLSQRLRHANQLIAQNHIPPVETLPQGRERAITADNTPVQLGFFDRMKRSLTGTRKVRISTKIKM